MKLLFFILMATGLAGCTQNSLAPLQQAAIVPTPDTIAIEISHYATPPGRIFRNIFVSNFSVKPRHGVLEYSTARDGFSDIQKTSLETTYGFANTVADTNSDGFSDLLMFLAGISTANQGTLFCGAQQRISSSNDAFSYADARLGGAVQFLGLRDCEKNFLQIKPTSFDFDGDGIPDYLELRAGLNPKNAGDANLSISGDGIPNIEKVKKNIPVDENAKSQPNLLFAYDYSTDFDSSGVRTFRIKNIPIMQAGIDNFIAIYVTERDPSTKVDYLYSAYLILHKPSANSNLRFPFWANDPAARATNQEIVLP